MIHTLIHWGGNPPSPVGYVWVVLSSCWLAVRGFRRH